MTCLKAIVAQKGTREYFLAARALHRKKCLVQMVVDWYTPNTGFLRKVFRKSSIATLSRAFSAYSAEIPDSLVKPMLIFGVYSRIHGKYFWRSKLFRVFTDPSHVFARRISKLKLPQHNVFFGYSYSSLEALIKEKREGKLTILDQIDPGALEREIISA